MGTPKVCVLRAPGTNCDVETAYAFELCGAVAKRVHVFRVMEHPELLDDYQILCVPGGFSYGDDIGAGVIFSRQMQNQLGDTLQRFFQQDKLALGICNGFQVLLKAGLLPGGNKNWPPESNAEPEVTLTWNENGRYTALWVHLQVGNTNSVFLRDIDRLELPLAHAEGRIAVTNDAIIDTWQQAGQIGLQYCDPAQNGAADLSTPLPYPLNPNGSIHNIAGLNDPSGRILGLMPHPERYIHHTQHPQWTRKQEQPQPDGLKIFENAVQYFE